MSHSVMVSITSILQALAPGDAPPLPEDGAAGADFMAEDQPPDGGNAAPVVIVPLPEGGPADLLQRLVETMSGISSALPEKPGRSIAQNGDAFLPVGNGALPPDDALSPNDTLPPTDALPLEDAAAGLSVIAPEPADGEDAPVVEATDSPGPTSQDGTAPKEAALPLEGRLVGTAPSDNLRSVPVADRGSVMADPAAVPQPAAPAKAGPEADIRAPRAALAERPDAPAPDLPGRTGPMLPEGMPADMLPLDRDRIPIDPVAGQVRAAPDGADLSGASPGRVVPVARQIAEALVATHGEVIEIALAPEELGRLRMVVSGPEQAPHVIVWVERPEVLDQLRRNGAFLQECLGDAGMGGASFEFRGDTPGDPQGSRADAAPERRDSMAMGLPVQLVPASWTPIAGPARLDIRI